MRKPKFSETQIVGILKDVRSNSFRHDGADPGHRTRA